MQARRRFFLSFLLPLALCALTGCHRANLVQSVLCVWNVPQDELRGQWQADTGYVLRLPWQAWPLHEQVRIVARMTVAEGKTVEVDREMRVHPGSLAARANLPQVPQTAASVET